MSARNVVDSNFLRSPRLEEYLAASRKNYALLPDYVSMEAYKGGPTIFQSMRILARYPKQVIVLKDTQTVCGLNPRNSPMQRLMIDQVQTRKCPEYCRDLKLAEAGDQCLLRQVLRLERAATIQMERIIREVGDFPSALGGIIQAFTKEELRELRTRAPRTDEISRKIIAGIVQLTARSFQNHPRVRKLPNTRQVPNTFIFRFSLCAFFLGLKWIEDGGFKDARPDRIRNDFVDASVAAYATFFDGLLSSDDKAKEIYDRANLFLSDTFPDCPLAIAGKR